MTLVGRWDDASELLEKQISSAVKRRDMKAQAALRTEQARVLVDRNAYHRRDTNSARRALEQAVVLVRQTADAKVAADLTHYLGQLHYGEAFATRNFGVPRVFFQEALAARDRMRDKRGLAESYFYLGLTYEQPGDPDTALTNYRKSLFYAQEAEDQVLESYAHRHIGGIEEERGQLDAAERSIRRSVELRRRTGFTVTLPFALIQLADFVERRRKDPDQAVRLLTEAVEVATKSRSTRAIQAARSELARLALSKNDAAAALVHAEAALAAARDFADPEGVQAAEKQVAEVRQKLAG